MKTCDGSSQPLRTGHACMHACMWGPDCVGALLPCCGGSLSNIKKDIFPGEKEKMRADNVLSVDKLGKISFSFQVEKRRDAKFEKGLLKKESLLSIVIREK